MKRLALFSFLTFLLWSAIPAGANTIPTLSLDCDSVTVGWASFPARPVDLNVTASQHGRDFTTTVSTEGQPAGEVVIPVEFVTGPASATVAWTLQNEHTVGPVTADLVCDTSTTTPTTEPSTTTSTVPDVTTVPTESPTTPTTVPGLPNTGASSVLAVLVGLGLVSVGAALLAGVRLRKVSR